MPSNVNETRTKEQKKKRTLSRPSSLYPSNKKKQAEPTADTKLNPLPKVNSLHTNVKHS